MEGFPFSPSTTFADFSLQGHSHFLHFTNFSVFHVLLGLFSLFLHSHALCWPLCANWYGSGHLTGQPTGGELGLLKKKFCFVFSFPAQTNIYRLYFRGWHTQSKFFPKCAVASACCRAHVRCHDYATSYIWCVCVCVFSCITAEQKGLCGFLTSVLWEFRSVEGVDQTMRCTTQLWPGEKKNNWWTKGGEEEEIVLWFGDWSMIIHHDSMFCGGWVHILLAFYRFLLKEFLSLIYLVDWWH